MPCGRHHHKSQTQDTKEKGKKRRPSKDSNVSSSSNMSSSDGLQLSPTTPTDDIDYIGIISEFFYCVD